MMRINKLTNYNLITFRQLYFKKNDNINVVDTFDAKDQKAGDLSIKCTHCMPKDNTYAFIVYNTQNQKVADSDFEINNDHIYGNSLNVNTSHREKGIATILKLNQIVHMLENPNIRYIETVPSEKADRLNEKLGFMHDRSKDGDIFMIKTLYKKDVLKNKDFYNQLFKKYNIDYRIAKHTKITFNDNYPHKIANDFYAKTQKGNEIKIITDASKYAEKEYTFNVYDAENNDYLGSNSFTIHSNMINGRSLDVLLTREREKIATILKLNQIIHMIENKEIEYIQTRPAEQARELNERLGFKSDFLRCGPYHETLYIDRSDVMENKDFYNKLFDTYEMNYHVK